MNAMSVGLDFLARLIKQKYKKNVEFYTVNERDILKLGKHDVDFLFVSLVGSGPALSYAKSVKFKKPAPFTAIGGPGMLFPATFRDMADAIMLGRGEDAIFRLIEGDYAGMMLRDSTLSKDSVHICRTSMLSPGQESVGCKFRCGFCSYSWMHTYSSSKCAVSDGFTSNRVNGAPQAEQMFKDLKFSMLSTSPFRRTIAGLDILTPADVRLIKKPVSISLVKSILRQMSKDSRSAFMGMYQLRLFTVTGYPWNDDPCDLTYINDAVRSVEFPDGISLLIDMSLNHFIPQICTPLECCAVRLDDMRKRFESYVEPIWPSTGAFVHIDRNLVPSPMQAVQQAILMRSADTSVVPIVASAKNHFDLAEKFSELCGWQPSKPAPWIRRNNDNSKRVKQFYSDLKSVCGLDIGMPSGYDEFEEYPDQFGIPVADFGKKEKRSKHGVSKGLAREL